MGQAFRRATGRIPASSTASSSKAKNVVDRGPHAGPTDEVKISRMAAFDGRDDTVGNPPFNADNMLEERNPPVNADNVLEERDPQYDAMLNQMLGRIKTKPGGKLEMGEATVMERHKRPMPKLRDTKLDSGRYEERPAPPGTLNVAQLRHVMLLHRGKADDHNGSMDAKQIAEKFQLNVVQVQTILQFLSLPPENTRKQKD